MFCILTWDYVDDGKCQVAQVRQAMAGWLK